MESIHENPATDGKIWKILTFVLAVVIVLIAVAWFGFAAAVQQEQEKLRAQVARNAAELERERAKNREIGKINLEAFLYEYNNLLEGLKQAIADYQAAKRLPPSDRAGSVEGAKRRLYSRVDAFMTFIARWRSVAETLNELLDGNVTRMEQARRNDNADDLEGSFNTLIVTFPSLKQQFEIKINILKNQ